MPGVANLLVLIFLTATSFGNATQESLVFASIEKLDTVSIYTLSLSDPLPERKLVTEFKVKGARKVYLTKISKNGKYIVVACEVREGTYVVSIADIEARKLIVSKNYKEVWDLSYLSYKFSNNSKYLVVKKERNSFELIDLNTGKTVITRYYEEDIDFNFSKNDNYIAIKVENEDNTYSFELIDLNTGKTVRNYKKVETVSYRFYTRYFVVGVHHKDGTTSLDLIDLNTGKTIITRSYKETKFISTDYLPEKKDYLYWKYGYLVFIKSSNNNRYLAVEVWHQDDTYSFELIDLNTGKTIRNYKKVWNIDYKFSHNSKFLAIKVWHKNGTYSFDLINLNTGKTIRAYKKVRYIDYKFSNNSKFLAIVVAHKDDTTSFDLINLNTNKTIRSYKKVRWIDYAFSPNLKFLTIEVDRKDGTTYSELINLNTLKTITTRTYKKVEGIRYYFSNNSKFLAISVKHKDNTLSFELIGLSTGKTIITRSYKETRQIPPDYLPEKKDYLYWKYGYLIFIKSPNNNRYLAVEVQQVRQDGEDIWSLELIDLNTGKTVRNYKKAMWINHQLLKNNRYIAVGVVGEGGISFELIDLNTAKTVTTRYYKGMEEVSYNLSNNNKYIVVITTGLDETNEIGDTSIASLELIDLNTGKTVITKYYKGIAVASEEAKKMIYPKFSKNNRYITLKVEYEYNVNTISFDLIDLNTAKTLITRYYQEDEDVVYNFSNNNKYIAVITTGLDETGETDIAPGIASFELIDLNTGKTVITKYYRKVGLNPVVNPPENPQEKGKIRIYHKFLKNNRYITLKAEYGDNVNTLSFDLIDLNTAKTVVTRYYKEVEDVNYKFSGKYLVITTHNNNASLEVINIPEGKTLRSYIAQDIAFEIYKAKS